MKKTRLLATVILTALLMVGVLGGMTVAADDTLPTVPLEGLGTEESPYLIADADDLIALSAFVNERHAVGYDADNTGLGNFSGYYFKQTADIDLAGRTWNPIGHSGDFYFAGNYDGGNHRIMNAYSTGMVDEYSEENLASELGFASAGIFGWTALGTIKNLHVENADFSATGISNYSYVGGIAGVNYAATYINCSVRNSRLESKRDPRNNNCAGGIAGYSTGGQFEGCASIDNQIFSRVYGGGFVGEIDDDYDVGTSAFTNCYVAGTSVTTNSPNVQDSNYAGGFAAHVTTGHLTVTNCFVYNTTIAIAPESVGGPKEIGVLAGSLWGNGSTVQATNSYYGACGDVTQNAGDAVEKTSGEFSDGTLTALLGDAYMDGGEYPILVNGLADYARVDAAVKAAEALDGTKYDKTAVDTAVAAVVPGKTNREQAEVDAMADTIEAAVAEWQANAEIAALKQAIEDLEAALNTTKTELETAINGRLTEDDMMDIVGELTEAYELADETLKKALQGEIDTDVAALKTTLEGVMNETKQTLAAVNSAMQEQLDKTASDLESTKAELNAAVNKANADHEAAKADLEAVKADLNSANTTQWALIIVVTVLALGNTVAVVLLFVQKTKKTKSVEDTTEA